MKKTIFLLTAVAALFFSSVSAQELPGTTSGQAADDEVIRVDTVAGQINLSIEDAALKDCVVKVFDNGVEGENVKVISPKDSPINVVIIVAMNPVKKWKLNKDELYKQVDLLRNETPGMNVQEIYTIKEADGFRSNLKFNQSREFESLPAAVTSATNLLRQSANRKAILVLTNGVEALPTDVIAQTSAELGKTSAMVYLMSINNTVKKNELKVQARTNVNGGSIVIKKADYLDGMFRSFKRLAANLHTVSYEYNVAENTAGDHRVTAIASLIANNQEVAKNIRYFNAAGSEKVSQPAPEPARAEATFLKASKPMTAEEIAVDALKDQSLAEILDSRPEKMSGIQIDGYVEELKRRPEMKGVKIYGSNDDLVKSVRENIAPVLKQYNRENYTRLVVYKSSNPFIALYRESILLISSSALGMLTAEEVRSSVAHELAHEVFGDELKAADQANDNSKQRVVEHKCDLVASLVLKNIQDDPFAVVVVAQKFEAWYAKNRPGLDTGAERAPSPLLREKCISMFLQNNNSNIAQK